MKKKGRIILPLGGVVISLAAVSALSASCSGVTQQQVENQTEILFTKTIDKLAQLPSAITRETLKPKVNIENGKVKEYSITTNDAEGKIIVKVIVEVKGKTFTIQKVLEGFKKNSNPADEPIVGENDDEKLANLLKKVSLNVSEGSYYDVVAKGKTKIKEGNKWNEYSNQTFVHLIIKGTNNKFDQAYLTSANIKLAVKTNITFDDASNTIFASIEYKTSTGEDKKEELKVVLQKEFTDEIKNELLTNIDPQPSKTKSCWTMTESDIKVKKDAELSNPNLQYDGLFIGYEKKPGKENYDKSLEQAKKGEMPVVFKFKDKSLPQITYYVSKTFDGLTPYKESQPGTGNSLEELAKNNKLFILDKEDPSYKTALEEIKKEMGSKKKWGNVKVDKEGIKFAANAKKLKQAQSYTFLKISPDASDDFQSKIVIFKKSGNRKALQFENENNKIVINFSITGTPGEGQMYTVELE